MDKFAAMQVFVRVVETGGMSAAGRALGLAPPSVSRRISELEDFLGAKLLHRTTRKLSLTEAGQIYFEKSREVVQAIEEANLAVRDQHSDPVGTLRVTTAASVSRLHLTPAIAAFQRKYSKVRVVVKVTERIVDLVEEGLDVAIRIGHLDDSSMIARKVGECQRVVCASPRYLKKHGRPVHPSDLSDHACLSYRSHAANSVWRFRKRKKIIEAQVSGPFFTDDGETLAAGACADLGVILAPEWLVGVAINEGALEQVLSDFKVDTPNTPLFALYAPGPYTPPKVRAFVDFLVERFSKNYDWRAAH